MMAEMQDQLDKLVGPPIQVDEELLAACREKGEFGELSFNLFREATALVWVACNMHHGNESDGMSLSRNQAVCAGLLSRISKLMMSVLKLSSGIEHGEAVAILNRCILESSVDLQFLLKKDDSSTYRGFVESGLKGERNLYDLIKRVIRERNGRQLEIERSMLASINRYCEKSGVRIEEIDPKAGGWGGSYWDKLDALGIAHGYPILQGMTSQSVHGSWSDLLRNHLDRNDSGYELKHDHTQTNGKYLGTMALFATRAAMAYIDRHFGPNHASFLVQRLDDVCRRIAEVEAARPGWELASNL